MNCQYCQHTLKFSHNENNKEIKVYECMNCPVHVMFHVFVEDGAIAKTVFILDKNKSVYLWTDDYLNDCSYITRIHADISNLTDSRVAKFEKIVAVTPSNVKDKLGLYMTFL